MLDGRLIRVQFRDWNPAYRPSWRTGPNRESDSQPLGSSDDISVDPKLHKPGIVDTAAHMADLQLADSPTQPAPPSTSEVCDLNEVQDETGNPPPETSSADGPECGSTKEVLGSEMSLDIKQGEPALPDATLLSSQTYLWYQLQPCRGRIQHLPSSTIRGGSQITPHSFRTRCLL